MAAGGDTPAVSVVVPTFNRPDATLAAVASVLAQNFTAFELIIVDDASPVPFEASFAGRDPRIRIIRHERNRGAAGARNTGVKASRADWIAFLDSDDLWAAEKLAVQRQAVAHADPMTALACGFTKVDAFDGSRVRQLPIAAADPLLFASGCWFCPGTAALVHRDAFRRVGPFDERLRRLEDLDWYLRFATAGGSLSVVPQVLCTVQIGGRPNAALVREAALRIMAKEAGGAYATARPADVRRRLRAYLALEQAAAAWNQRPRTIRHGLETTAHLMRSWWAVPRGSLHLERFWRAP